MATSPHTASSLMPTRASGWSGICFSAASTLHDERLGYAWLELGRRGEDGPAFCTIGCGMKAVKGRGIAAHWFFVTDQRVGEDLALVDATGVALTADRLEDAIGPRGSVHRRARDHRRAVDERLFGLGDVRYGGLIDLLIKIRAPQLSKRPDERGLSDALTGALPPLDQAMMADVAEAFRALEEDGEQLAAMIEARDASERYLTTYRAYARMATRRRAAPVRQAQTVFDRVSRELAEAEENHARAHAELPQARETLERASSRARRASTPAARRSRTTRPRAARRELRRAAEEAEQAGRRRADAHGAVERLERADRRASATGSPRPRPRRRPRRPSSPPSERGGRPCQPRAYRRRGWGTRSPRPAPPSSAGAHRGADRTPADSDRPRADSAAAIRTASETRSRRRGRAPRSLSASTPR